MNSDYLIVPLRILLVRLSTKFENIWGNYLIISITNTFKANLEKTYVCFSTEQTHKNHRFMNLTTMFNVFDSLKWFMRIIVLGIKLLLSHFD